MKLEETILKSLFNNKQLEDLKLTFDNEKVSYLDNLEIDTFAEDATDEIVKIWYKNYLVENDLIKEDDINNDYHINKLYDITKDYFL